MIESVTIMNLFNGGHEYLLKVYTKRVICRLLRKEFHQEWEKTVFLRKRRVEVDHKEIRIYLKKGDSIQKYIDSVPRVLRMAGASLRQVQENRNRVRRKWVLKRDVSAKTYLRRQQSSIVTAVDRAIMP
ncbi:MAG: hypothetical protein ABFD25_14445 [Clostridiaceae bacterium]